MPSGNPEVKETVKFVYDEYYADGVVYEDLFGVGGGCDSDVDFVVREYLDEYSDLRLDFRSETDHSLLGIDNDSFPWLKMTSFSESVFLVFC